MMFPDGGGYFVPPFSASLNLWVLEVKPILMKRTRITVQRMKVSSVSTHYFSFSCLKNGFSVRAIVFGKICGVRDNHPNKHAHIVLEDSRISTPTDSGTAIDSSVDRVD